MQMMEEKKHPIVSLILLLVILGTCTWVFVSIAKDFEAEHIHQFDYSIIQYVQGFISEPITNLVLKITFLGSSIGIAIITFVFSLILVLFRKYLLGIYLLMSVAVGYVGLNTVLKHIFQRERPSILRLVEEHGFSFPSGHSMGSMVLFGSLLFIVFKLSKSASVRVIGVIAALTIILIIGLTRVYLGVHYPTDIVGGYTAGIVWLTISVVMFNQIEKRTQKQDKLLFVNNRY